MSERPATCSDETDETGGLGALVATLPERWRSPFLLRMLDGRSFRQIEAVTGIPWGTVHGWSQREEWRAASRAAWAILTRVRLDNWRAMVVAAERELHAVLDGAGDPSDRLRAAQLVLDRSGLGAGQQLVDPDAGNDATPPLHTPEGREAALVELASLPPDLLIEALRRLREAAPEHLREGLPDV